jgi:transcription initiation factor TFIIE subunit alpha
MLVALKKTKSRTVKSKKARKAVKKLKSSKAGIKANSAKALRNAKKIQKKPVKRPPEPSVPAAPVVSEILLQKVGKILSDSHVRQDLIEIGGENALAIVRNFYGNHSDEELAKKLKIKISDVRATLNKLHNEGLVNYIREKDSETGWYSYSWSLNHERMERWATAHTAKLSALGTESGGEYYFCPSCGASSITNFESAATIEFRCERCNRLLEFIDEKKMADLFEKQKP